MSHALDKDVAFNQVGSPAGFGGSTRRNAPASVCIYPSRSDISPYARLSPLDAGKGTDVCHSAFGWHSPRAFENSESSSPNRLRRNSLPASPSPSFTKASLTRRNSLSHSLPASTTGSPTISPVLLRGISAEVPATATSATSSVISSSGAISPSVIHGDVHGRIAAAARVKSYLLKEERASYARLPREPQSTPDWFKRADSLRRAACATPEPVIS